MIISADRRRKNLGEIYKPTVPRRNQNVEHRKEAGGFTKCKNKCDVCAHSCDIRLFKSVWDQRRWQIRKTLTCKTKNVVYMIRCKIHSDACYIGSTTNLKLRWANHKSDCKLKKVTKCSVADHVSRMVHPNDATFSFLEIFAIDAVEHECDLHQREIWWQCNIGTFFKGLNIRKDFQSMLRKNRVQY